MCERARACVRLCLSVRASAWVCMCVCLRVCVRLTGVGGIVGYGSVRIDEIGVEFVNVNVVVSVTLAGWWDTYKHIYTAHQDSVMAHDVKTKSKQRSSCCSHPRKKTYGSGRREVDGGLEVADGGPVVATCRMLSQSGNGSGFRRPSSSRRRRRRHLRLFTFHSFSNHDHIFCANSLALKLLYGEGRSCSRSESWTL